MKNPITAIKEKIEDHKVLLASTGGVVIGTVATVVVMKRIPTRIPNVCVHLADSNADLIETIEKCTNGFELVTKDNVVRVFTSDTLPNHP